MEWVRDWQDNESLGAKDGGFSLFWNVYGYEPGALDPAWYGLVQDRPEFFIGTPHYALTSFAVSRITPKRIAAKVPDWNVEIVYERIESPEKKEKNPLDRPPRISMQSRTVEVPTFVDADGKPIFDSAGSLVEGLTKLVTFRDFSVSVFLANPPAWIQDYNNTVNSDTVILMGQEYTAGHLLLTDLSIGEEQSETDGETEYRYTPVSFKIEENPDEIGWKTRIWNKGFYAKNAETGKRERIMVETDEEVSEGEEKKKVPIDEPAWLDANGALIENPTPDNVTKQEKWLFPRKPFAIFPIR